MKLTQAKAIVDLNAAQLTAVINKAYQGDTVEAILDYDIRQDDVKFTVRMEDDGSIEATEAREIADYVVNVFVSYDLDGDMHADY